MKKLIAVLLAALMLFTVIPMAAFAADEKKDVVIEDILNGEYEHLNYVKAKKYFKTERALYTVGGLYDNAWDNFFTGSVNTDYAKTILLALIDRFEAEYNNETFEEILAVLKTTQTVAGLVEKVDQYTEILDLAANSAWADSLGVLNTLIKVGNMANDTYEKYVEGYAVILSCQAASVYYGELLQYIADNSSDKNMKKAALELKENITASLEEARDALIAELTADVAKDGAEIGIQIAMDSYGVTAVIKTVYNTIGNLGNKLFSTQDKYQYMTSLAMIAEIESFLPAYIAEAMNGEEELGASFALNAMITIRETGEGMLLGLAKVKEDSKSEALLKNSTADIAALKKMGAEGCAKLALYRDLIAEGLTEKVCDVFVNADKNKIMKIYNAEGELVASARDAKVKVANESCVIVSEHNDTTDSFVKAAATFVEGCTVSYAESASSTGGNTSSGSKKGFAAFLQSIIDAITNFFANLFK